MKIKRIIIAVLTIAMVLAMGSSISFAEEATEATTIRVGTGIAPVAFNQLLYGSETQSQLTFEGLFDYNPVTCTVEPVLAESYEIIDEYTTRIKLKDNVYFSNGAKLTAEDVIYSYKRHVDGGSTVIANYAVFDFEKCVAEDELTVLLVTASPCGDILMNLCKFCDIVNKDFYENTPEEALWDQTCGTGPYACVENVSGSHVTFQLREDYWNKDNMPQAQTIILQYYSEISTMLIDFENGALDIVIGLDESSANRLADGEYADATLKTYSTFGVDYVILPEYTTEFQDAKVRQAIAHAVDWAVVAENAYGSLGSVATSVLPSSMTNYYKNEGVYEYDPELAKQLLAEAGYENGFTIDTMSTNNPTCMAMYETIQYYLGEVGITLNFTPNEMSAVMPSVAMGQVSFFVLLSQSTSAPDPTAVLEHQRADAMLAACKITDEEYNAMYQKFINSSDAAERTEAMNWMQDYLYETAAVIPVAENSIAFAFSSKVKDVNITSSAMAELQYIELN